MTARIYTGAEAEALRGAAYPSGGCPATTTPCECFVARKALGDAAFGLAASVAHHEKRAERAEALAQIHREERDACAAEVLRLRAIIEGRTTPPTREEVEAHCATGGAWRSIVPGEWILSTGDGDPEDVADTIGVQSANAAIVAGAGVRWWAVDREGRPCAWPVAPEVTP